MKQIFTKINQTFFKRQNYGETTCETPEIGGLIRWVFNWVFPRDRSRKRPSFLGKDALGKTWTVFSPTVWKWMKMGHERIIRRLSTTLSQFLPSPPDDNNKKKKKKTTTNTPRLPPHDRPPPNLIHAATKI